MTAKTSNNASSRLALAIGIGAVSLSVQPGDGAKFPALSSPGDWFPLTAVKADGTLEIMRCTARSGDVLTVTRAQEGTTAKAFTTNDRIDMRLTSGAFESRMADKVDVAGGSVTGDLGVAGTLATGKKVCLKVGDAIASSATFDLSTATGALVHITGTASISEVLMSTGQIVEVIFDEALLLVHHAVKNNLPGAANVTTAAGDRALYVSDGNTVYCLDYNLADGTPLVRAHNVGDIFMHAGDTAPVGALACPTVQTNLNRTTYAKLFARIGTRWGAGDGATTFGMPWFPPDYAPVQGSGNVGTSTVGANISHAHGINDSGHVHTAVDTGHNHPASYGTSLGSDSNIYQTANGGTGVSNNVVSTGKANIVVAPNVTGISIQASGGSANLAAGVRLLMCVQIA